MNDDFDIDQLFASLDSMRDSLGLTWSGVEKEFTTQYTKVAASTIKGIRDKQTVEGDGVLQMLLWLQRSPESFMPGISDKKAYQLTEPNGLVLRFDVKKMYQLLDARRPGENLTWAEMTDQIGDFTPGRLTRFKKGGRTSFPGVSGSAQNKLYRLLGTSEVARDPKRRHQPIAAGAAGD